MRRRVSLVRSQILRPTGAPFARELGIGSVVSPVYATVDEVERMSLSYAALHPELELTIHFQSSMHARRGPVSGRAA